MQYWFCQSTKMWHRGNCRFHHPTQNFKLTPKLEFTAINLQFMNFVEMFCQSEAYRLQYGRYAVTRRYSRGACCRSSSLSKWDERKVISRALKTRRSFSYHSAFFGNCHWLDIFCLRLFRFPESSCQLPACCSGCRNASPHPVRWRPWAHTRCRLCLRSQIGISNS